MPKNFEITKGNWVAGMFIVGAGLGVLLSGVSPARVIPSDDKALMDAIARAKKINGAVVIRSGKYIVLPGSDLVN